MAIIRKSIQLVKFIRALIALVYATIYHLVRNIVLLLVPICRKSKDVSKDVVLITGAGSGIGRIMALKFAKLGSTLVLWDINGEAIEETARIARESSGAKVYTYVCDVSKAESVYKTADAVRLHVGKVTILINNAGIVSGKPILDIPDEMIVKTMQINSLAHFWTVKAFLPGMIDAKRGHIVEIDSVAGFCGSPFLTDYCASKHAVYAFSESLKNELRYLGKEFITVTVICPFIISTGMFSGADFGRFCPRPLEPERVAQRTVDAILTNEQLVLIPGILSKINAIVKTILPVRIADQLQNLVSSGNPMKNFKGRYETTKSN